MKSYQSLPYTTYTQKNSSEYVYRIQSHTDQISQHTISSILRIISEGLITLMQKESLDKLLVKEKNE